MNEPTLSLISEALATVSDPELHRPLPDLGMVEEVHFADGIAKLKILLTISGCPMRDRLQKDISEAVLKVPQVSSVEIEFGVMNETQRDNVKKLLRGGREKFIPFAQPDSLTRVWGISSGKGGVGKSSVTVNLAAALSARGLKVGVLDADVYGHSIPRLFGIEGQRPTAIDQTFIPVEVRGIKVVSIEMFKPDRADPVAYRGPLLHRVLEQLLSDAYWGDLDFLLLDLPPGTGDIAISLGQLYRHQKLSSSQLLKLQQQRLPSVPVGLLTNSNSTSSVSSKTCQLSSMKHPRRKWLFLVLAVAKKPPDVSVFWLEAMFLWSPRSLLMLLYEKAGILARPLFGRNPILKPLNNSS